MKLRAMKFRVNNPEHSRVVQQVLFDLGYNWAEGAKFGGEDNGPYILAPYVLADASGKITYGILGGAFREHDGLEIDVSWMDPNLYKEEKTVEVGGKVYRESDVIERCKPLDPVG